MFFFSLAGSGLKQRKHLTCVTPGPRSCRPRLKRTIPTDGRVSTPPISSGEEQTWVETKKTRLKCWVAPVTRCSLHNYHQLPAGWWFGCHFLFSHILGISSSQLTNSYISEGWPNHQPAINYLPFSPPGGS